MFRTFLVPAASFLAGLGTLKVAIPLESLALMALGIALTGFGILRLLLRYDANALPVPARPEPVAEPEPEAA